MERTYNNGNEHVDLYNPRMIYSMMEQFENSRAFIRHKFKDGKLHCDACGAPFPANLPFYITIIEATEELICHPCNYMRMNNNPYAEYKNQLAKKHEAINNKRTEREKLSAEKEQKKQQKEQKMRMQQRAMEGKKKQQELF